ncbi:MAG: POTRA domain-containing protein [Acidobacteriota bacterium]
MTPGGGKQLKISKQPYPMVIWLAITFLFVCTLTTDAQQSATQPQEWKLTKIAATGLSRYTVEQVAKLTNLTLGQKVDLAILDAATLRLRDTGLFNQVTYGYRYQNDQLTVTFKIEEAVWDTPVIFDNFVWFTDEELIKAIAQTVPSFDGTAPKSGNLTSLIAQTLEQLLSARQIAGAVEYLSSSELTGNHFEHVFVVKNLNLPVCALHFPKASGIKENVLINAVKTTSGGQYSKSALSDFARNHLFQLYREQGYLKARFQSIDARLLADANCKNGVDVSILIDEGASYTLDKIEWSDNLTLSTKELDSLLAMKPGEVANGVKFDNGLKTIKAAYGKKGFIRAQFNIATTFDEESKRAASHITVKEGAQYHMGLISFNGLPMGEAEKLQKRWRLKTGEIFDTTYLDDFLNKDLDPKLNARLAGIRAIPSEQNLTVDVQIIFK